MSPPSPLPSPSPIPRLRDPTFFAFRILSPDMPTARAHGLEVWLCTLVTAPAPEADIAAPATHGPRPLDARCALNAPPSPPSLPGRVHWVVYPAASQAREMSCDRQARRCIASVDDRRCERGHPHIALGTGLRAGARVASLPTWAVTGGLSQLRTRPRRLERSCFTSRRSAHGPRPSICGLFQPPAARYRPSRPQRGLNAQRNVALYGRPVAAKNTPPPSRAVVLHLTAERSWTEALHLRPISAASRTLSPFPAPARPKFGPIYTGSQIWPR